MSVTTVAPMADGHVSPSPHALRRERRARRREERSHWLAGWRDGRQRRPSLEEGAAIPDRLVLLITASQATVEQRWKALLEETHGSRLELATIPDEIKQAIARSERATAALTAHVSAGPERSRKFGEDQVPDELVQARRKREHAARTAELTEARDHRTNDVHMKAQRQRELREHITLALDSARAAARADLSRNDALATAYRRGVLRTHDNPVELEHQAHRFTIPRPDWVRHADVEEFLRAAGAGSDR